MDQFGGYALKMVGQQQKVYDAENEFCGFIDNAWQSPLVQLGPVAVLVPAERKFRSVNEVNMFIVELGRRLSFHAPRVVGKVGQEYALYDPSTHVMAIPSGGHWALRETVILHELSHAVSQDRDSAGHGPKFTRTFLNIIDVIMGDDAALLMTALYRKHGVRVAEVSHWIEKK